MIRLTSVLIPTDRMPPIRSQHTGVTVYPKSGWRRLGLVFMGIAVCGAAVVLMAGWL
jgi:hypothetical protein